ncbi:MULTISPECIES: hypothetical protein [Vibrio]|uniref:hypothetical protein n=1 Tax=Vibrio TaxID=662 RepID=UPI001EEA0B9F|nr:MULTISPECIES: hypothetical protein [Vibrio]MCG6367017.1 hypothetical protein [Vibrio fluvialis]MCG6375622.1 hypothetical protein [Vibrio fluvialis]MCX9579863.1 hypothetical protein [Vibrio cholerae]
MKTPQQEITEMLLSNAGNRLTNELIAGMQARIFKALDANKIKPSGQPDNNQESEECLQSE